MIKASELIKQQKDRDLLKHKTYEKIYAIIEKKISLASLGNNYYTWYEIPQTLIGVSSYSIGDCEKYIGRKLKDNGFNAEFYDPNILYINWIPREK